MNFRPEDGKRIVCRNVGYFSTFDADHPQKAVLCIELQPREPEDNKYRKNYAGL
jgi:hypothetical protein